MSNIILNINGQKRPCLIDLSYGPYFSWKYTNDLKKDYLQEAYQIIVKENDSVVWDSGKVNSNKQQMIIYDGEKLKTQTEYEVNVKTWGNGNVECNGSSSFFTGASGQELSKAKWLSGKGLLRKEFSVEDNIKRAYVYVTTVGYYELYLNGNKVGDQVITPSHTDPDKNIEFQAYEITNELLKGQNAIGIMTGGGFVKCEPFFIKNPSSILMMVIEYQNGNKQTLVTDETWQTLVSPIVEDNVFSGEKYDARLETKGWANAGLDIECENATVVDAPKGVLEPQILSPIKIHEIFKPVSINKLDDGKYVVDFGQNTSGIVRIRVSGKAGETITLRHCEVLNKDGSANQMNLRIVEECDKYTLKGEGIEEYRPHFTFHGYRYVQIENWPGEMTKDSVESCATYSSVERIGNFECSDDLFNKIYKAMCWSLKTNLHSVPTDCPQRNERRGWIGDGHTASISNMYNSDMHWFYRKWLRDIKAVTDEETGEMYYSSAPRFIDDCCFFTWSSGLTIMPYNLWKYYDDIEIVKEFYPLIKKNLAFTATFMDKDIHLILDPGRLDHSLIPFDTTTNDWLAVDRTRNVEVMNSFYYDQNRMMSEMAEALGYEDDKKHYLDEMAQVKEAYNKKFLLHRRRTPIDMGIYGQDFDNSQCSQSMPLLFGICPDTHIERAFNTLISDVTEERGETVLTGGLIGTPIIVDCLHKFGRDDVIADIFSRDKYPSWGFMINKGATTIWERWLYMVSAEMNSHNHAHLCSPSKWLYYGLAGLGFGETNSDGQHIFEIKPYIKPDMDYAKASIDSIWGEVSTSWKKVNGKVEFTVVIPPNTKAHVIFGNEDKVVGSGTYTFIA